MIVQTSTNAYNLDGNIQGLSLAMYLMVNDDTAQVDKEVYMAISEILSNIGNAVMVEGKLYIPVAETALSKTYFVPADRAFHTDMRDIVWEEEHDSKIMSNLPGVFIVIGEVPILHFMDRECSVESVDVGKRLADFYHREYVKNSFKTL